VIDDNLLEALRQALSERLRRASDDDEIRRALRSVSQMARDRSLQAEHVVIALKQVWASLPEVHNAATSYDRARILERLVMLCIDEYYRDDSA
jgi:hypothetical protein